jgi:1-acyl-sn-glycerol-3-phosphate acyltransferase
MSRRDVARAAKRCIEIARERLALGEALLIFGEGTRSRTGHLQPLLPGVARYFEIPGLLVVPAAIIGTERLYPIGEGSLNPVRCEVTLGKPISADTLRERSNGDRRLMMDMIGLAIADLLPVAYRGTYGQPLPDLVDVRRVLKELN